MQASDRVLLIDVENVLGGLDRRRPLVFQTRIAVLLGAAGGPLHHCVAAFGMGSARDQALLSLLAEIGVAPWPVTPGPNAADRALLEHAQHVYRRGGRTFVVASGDHRLAEVARLGRLEVVAWQRQQVSKRLIEAAQVIRRIPLPGRARK